MRAFVLSESGGTPNLEDYREPSAADGTITVTVRAAGINPVDIAQSGPMGRALPLPRVVGNEAVVEFDGGLAYSERTIAPFGSFAERALVDPQRLIPLPASVDPAAALAIGIAGIAAWNALDTRAKLQPGETVIVLGATGASGRIAVTSAKLLGAKHVVAAGRDRASLEALRAIGADAIAVMGTDDDTAVLREAAHGGADVVFDPVFGKPLVAALGALNAGGRTVTIGGSAGRTTEIPLAAFLGKQLLSWANIGAPPDVKRAAYERLLQHLVAGELPVETEIVPFARVAEAWKRQQESPRKKLVLAM